MQPDHHTLEAFNWRASLRAWRKRKHLTQAALAELSGVSLPSIRSYENGKRHPSAQALTTLVFALGVPRQDANQMLAAAGYAVDWRTLLGNRYVFDLDQAQAALDECPWPAFLTDQGVHLVAANRLFELVWDVDLANNPLPPAQRNFIAGMSDPRFTQYIDNFDELVGFMLGLAKGDPRLRQDMENPAPWLAEALSLFLQGDPQLINRVITLWESVEPLPHRTRHQYEIRWLYRGELPMRFKGILTIADLWNEVSWNDWIPADAGTWQALTELSSARS